MKQLNIRTEEIQKPNLGRADWLRSALHCLIKDGIDAVQITRLATSLGVSRGSFYWHFKLRQDLLDGLLEEWSAANSQCIADVLARSDSLDRGVLSIFAVWTDPSQFSSPLEQAVRDWARLDESVLDKVRAEDANRLATLSAFFQRFDYSEHEAIVRARVLYFAQVGYYAMNVNEALEARMSMLDLYYLTFTGRRLDRGVSEEFQRDWQMFT
ncbi:MAG: AcrR family transcriptional regulator [Yoonia sp.]|jgi:AcrR family transcriptional regulator